MLIDDRRTRLDEETARRYDRPEIRRTREAIVKQISSRASIRDIEDADRLNLRRTRLRLKGVPGLDEALFERTIGGADFLHVNYLSHGLQVSRAVARVLLKDQSGRPQGAGTGFMVSPTLLLTNNHVFAAPDEAIESLAEFNFEYPLGSQTLSGVSFRLDPAKFFVTDVALDYTLVAVADTSVGGTPLADYGWIPIEEEEGKLALSEYVSIIQHPKGGPKQLVLRENQVIARLENFLHYKTDTEPGSSGSPVFNDQWEVVALHHSGVPAKKGGGARWVANEGVRISRILRHLKSMHLDSERDRLRADVLAARSPESNGGSHKSVAAPQVGLQAELREDGTAVWNIPLHVAVRLGPERGTQKPPASLPPLVGAARVIPSQPDPPELQRLLAEAREAQGKPYYQDAPDAKDRTAYYQGIKSSLKGKPLFQALTALLTSSHINKPKYAPHREVYPWVDLRPDGKLRSVYSNLTYTAEELIRESYRVEQARERFERSLRERLESLPSQQIALELDALEASLPYNCEHVVPQSWFAKQEPMRGDLHHLFACESNCNSFRGNTPYFDFPDYQEVVREDCGKREMNADTSKPGFEPALGKGEVTRATLYFILRYPKEVSGSKEYPKARLKILRQWHREFPVTRYEKHRNAAIFARQGNRNPFIDHPEWVESVDLAGGLG